ncbi:unnamed protein product [Acanthoscelides obtectus]|uniref:Uncharacterized protein n=1 Tax=Acanthoscelides obtectus TaxID=200917 RepID=A0A9P0P299_ACAOB|nr:unnamed protein product [Acanthoscelides obtectus]CAK1667422.1 hypothetical protein AOBTE_LOCUS25828 [Acanthoscelides obtectus]
MVDNSCVIEGTVKFRDGKKELLSFLPDVLQVWGLLSPARFVTPMTAGARPRMRFVTTLVYFAAVYTLYSEGKSKIAKVLDEKLFQQDSTQLPKAVSTCKFDTSNSGATLRSVRLKSYTTYSSEVYYSGRNENYYDEKYISNMPVLWRSMSFIACCQRPLREGKFAKF